IHISGCYVIRERADVPAATQQADDATAAQRAVVTPQESPWMIDVMPQVRIGPPGSPATLAHVVHFPLARGDSAECPWRLGRAEYDRLLERVYFSIASQIYRQIRQDVRQKIDLLPTRYFKAVAYVHEAEDYARSNTIDAYDDALSLYAAARTLYDPFSTPLSVSRVRQAAERSIRWGWCV